MCTKHFFVRAQFTLIASTPFTLILNILLCFSSYFRNTTATWRLEKSRWQKLIVQKVAHSKQQRSLTGTEHTGTVTMISIRIPGYQFRINCINSIRYSHFLRSLQTNEEIVILSNSCPTAFPVLWLVTFLVQVPVIFDVIHKPYGWKSGI
jgi:hypothetical protein